MAQPQQQVQAPPQKRPRSQTVAPPHHPPAPQQSTSKKQSQKTKAPKQAKLNGIFLLCGAVKKVLALDEAKNMQLLETKFRHNNKDWTL